MSETAPEFMSISAAMDAKQVNETGSRAVDALREAARAGKVERVTDPNAPRSFVSPTHPNSKFLVTAGRVEQAPYQQAVLGLRPAIERIGDVWVKFTSSVCTTKEPEVIAWLEAHSGYPERHRAYHEAKGEDPRSCGAPIGLCREQGPGIDDWFKMKQSQLAMSYRPAGLDPDIDIDAYMRGDHIRESSKSTSGDVSRVIEADQNAAAERADGNRN